MVYWKLWTRVVKKTYGVYIIWYAVPKTFFCFGHSFFLDPLEFSLPNFFQPSCCNKRTYIYYPTKDWCLEGHLRHLAVQNAHARHGERILQPFCSDMSSLNIIIEDNMQYTSTGLSNMWQASNDLMNEEPLGPLPLGQLPKELYQVCQGLFPSFISPRLEPNVSGWYPQLD